MAADRPSGGYRDHPGYGADAGRVRPSGAAGTGTGRPGKAEFPASWDDERTIGYIMDVARHPDTRPVWQPNHRWRLRGERDAVAVTVIVKPDGGIWAAWPEEGSPGVTRNPSGGQS